MSEDNMNIDNDTTPRLVVEEMLWNPELSGVKNFLHLQMIGEAGVDGFFCNSDKVIQIKFLQSFFLKKNSLVKGEKWQLHSVVVWV